MAYTRAWNEAVPPDTAAANTLSDIIRKRSVDLRERLQSLLGITDFTVDPLKCEKIDLSGVAASKIIGGSTSISIRDSTDANDNLLIDNSGNVTARADWKSGSFDVNINMKAGHTISLRSPIDVIATQAAIDRATPIAAGASQAIDWNTGNNQAITLGSNSTLSFSNPKSGGWYFLEVKQTGAGSFLITWPAAVKWPGATAPTLTTTTGQTDFLSFYYNGTNYAGFLVGLNYGV